MNLNFLVSFEVVLIIMFTVITWNQNSKKIHLCSRDRSKIVRDVIHKKFTPILSQHQASITKSCPFHPERDYLWWPIDQKEEEDFSDSFWTCPFCGLDFFCPERLTLHWDEEHRDSYSKLYRDDLVCLADYCDIFRCDVLIKKKLQRKKHRFMGYLSFGQQENFKCETTKMDYLQQSCFNVIHQCATSLETNVSSQNLARLEKELSDSVCSFLTCDNYNDDLFADDNASRKVPIVLFSTIGVIMIGGFCFCYYLIWTFIERGLINLNEHSEDQTKKIEPKFCRPEKSSDLNSNAAPKSYSNSGKFFQNIFEFNQDNKEETFEFNDMSVHVPDKFEPKLHSISSIIEEDEEEEKDESEIDISYNSYPIINRKYIKRNYDPKKNSSIFTINELNKPLHSQSKKELRQVQEICLQELPVKVHPKYIQPLKHSYSDRYPCYSGQSPDNFEHLSTKSRSFSHSQLRNTQHSARIATRTRRQDSIEEEWEQKSQQSHSSLSMKTSLSASKILDSNGRVRNTSKSSLSYNAMHPTKRDDSGNFSSIPSSKTNSDVSIASRASVCSRMTSHSSQAFLKR